MKHVVHTVRSQGGTGDGIATAVIRKSVHDLPFFTTLMATADLSSFISFLPSNCFWNLSYSVMIEPDRPSRPYG